MQITSEFIPASAMSSMSASHCGSRYPSQPPVFGPTYTQKPYSSIARIFPDVRADDKSDAHGIATEPNAQFLPEACAGRSLYSCREDRNADVTSATRVARDAGRRVDSKGSVVGTLEGRSSQRKNPCRSLASQPIHHARRAPFAAPRRHSRVGQAAPHGESFPLLPPVL